MDQRITTESHWGIGIVKVDDGRVVSIEPDNLDSEPSPLLSSMPESTHSRARILRPTIRRDYLKHGLRSDRNGRGSEPFVDVPWDEALDIAASAIEETRTTKGNEAIFAGSYGWASAGRFHHAQSQIHRFMKLAGGYTGSVDNYSYGAALVVTPHIVGSLRQLVRESTTWPVVEKHGELAVMFGGMPVSNTQIVSGSMQRPSVAGLMHQCRRAGVEFVCVSPYRGDSDAALQAEWMAPRPNTDVAVMLGLAHTLVEEGLHNTDFLTRYTVGFDRFRAYLTGETDGVPKTADWASRISGLAADTIKSLARRMAGQRTLVCMAAGLQRADHGEQAVMMTITLAALLGQIGLPGGGFGLLYGSDGLTGKAFHNWNWPPFPQGNNPVGTFIPVARISDMLLHPGTPFDYNGTRYTYPDIDLVYWAGGNPFHHHQDINRLVRAFRQPGTIIVNEISWNGLAKHADIVFPATSTLERNDLGLSRHDDRIVAMKQAIPPVGEARNDFDIFDGLSARLGFAKAFTEGLDEDGWLRRIWNGASEAALREGIALPDFETFWEKGIVELSPPDPDRVLLQDFRNDPGANPLKTPSGLIELFSETLDGFGHADCPGHAAWIEPSEWLGAELAETYPFHLVSGQPPTRLHGQLDDGKVSLASKVAGREPVLMNPSDASDLALSVGDVVRLFNDRGACLAGLVVSDDVRRGVVILRTGAWYDPEEPGTIGSMDKHGNPNVLTQDRPASRLSQATAAHTCLVQVEKFTGTPPPVTAHNPPAFISRP